MKLTLQFIRLADWFDVHLLRHTFPRICNAIYESEWWDMPPEPPVSIDYSRKYDELKVRISECPTEVSQTVNGVTVLYDGTRNLIGMDISMRSTFVPDDEDIDE